MSHKTDAWPANLSGGQQQRVAIARALAPSPKVLLCDEPTSALDPELAGEVVDVLGQLAREGTTMVMATHDLRLASQIANHVVFLEAGQVVETGDADAIFRHPERERTRRFVSSITPHRRSRSARPHCSDAGGGAIRRVTRGLGYCPCPGSRPRKAAHLT